MGHAPSKKGRSAKELAALPKVTLRQVAIWLFTKEPHLTDEQLNAELDRADVPHDKFTRKDASHYRTLWKQGRLR